jgi:hypothetical protein
MKRIYTLLCSSLLLAGSASAQYDVGCSAINSPSNNDTVYLNTADIDPNYDRTNFGIAIPNTVDIMMRFYVDGVQIDSVPRPKNAFASGASETRRIGRTINFNTNSLSTGVHEFAVVAYTANDVDRSNDTSKISFYFKNSNYQPDLAAIDFVMLEPSVANGGDVENTSTFGNAGFKLRNDGTADVPAGYTGQIRFDVNGQGINANIPLSTGLAAGATTQQFSLSNSVSIPFPSTVGATAKACAIWIDSNDPNALNDSACGTYTIVQGLVVTSFSPNGAYVGQPVTITGEGFSTTKTDNVVKLNGTVAEVTASTATSIEFIVPSGATSGKISVTVAGKTKESATNFLVIPNATSIDNVENAKEVAMFYNNGLITVDNADMVNAPVFVTNVAGQQLGSFEISEEGTVDVSNLESGIYIASFNANTLKFVVD